MSNWAKISFGTFNGLIGFGFSSLIYRSTGNNGPDRGGSSGYGFPAIFNGSYLEGFTGHVDSGWFWTAFIWDLVIWIVAGILIIFGISLIIKLIIFIINLIIHLFIKTKNNK